MNVFMCIYDKYFQNNVFFIDRIARAPVASGQRSKDDGDHFNGKVIRFFISIEWAIRHKSDDFNAINCW